MDNLIPQSNLPQCTNSNVPDVAVSQLKEILSSIRPGLMLIDTMEGNVNIYGNNKKPFPAYVNRDYYNLFVIPGSEIKTNRFQMPVDYCLSEKYGTEKSITRWLTHLRDLEIQAELMNFPSILATRSVLIDGTIKPTQSCQYGFISEISVEPGCIEFEFNFSDGIPQRLIESLAKESRLKNNPRATELSVVHWAVKRADLAKILFDSGQDISHPRLR